MKKILPLAFLFCCFSFLAFSQNAVTLNIHHKLADNDFAFNTATQNNMNNTFQYTRVEYYISGISIVHDGGTETAIEDKWILANAYETTTADLGTHDITDVESIKFYVGVEEEVNHLDPASYAADHPLAPQNPSMHWGWASGYRFIAVEGDAGDQMNYDFELHGLGDDNYFQTTIDATASASGGEVVINLDADYTKVMEDIDLSSGVIVHGFGEEALHAIENFRDFVFSPSTGVSSTEDLANDYRFEVYPNPTFDGMSTIYFSLETPGTYQVKVLDILGRQIHSCDIAQGNTNVDIRLEITGLYVVALYQNGRILRAQKVMRK